MSHTFCKYTFLQINTVIDVLHHLLPHLKHPPHPPNMLLVRLGGGAQLLFHSSYGLYATFFCLIKSLH